MPIVEVRVRATVAVLALLGAAAGPGCLPGPEIERDPFHGPPLCDPDEQFDGECVGVPPQDLCGAPPCTAGVTCASIVEVQSDATLSAALATASPGTCIALADGRYGVASLPGGVHLLGRAAAHVVLEGLTVASGADSIVRGLTVRGEGVVVADSAQASLFAVRVQGAGADGIDVRRDARLGLERCEVDEAGRVGVRVGDGASASLHRSLVRSATRGGILGRCEDGCACQSPPAVTLDEVVVRRAGLVGVWLVGARADLARVRVVDSQPNNFEGGFGLSMSECGDLTAASLEVLRAANIGVLVDHASVRLGDGAVAGGRIEGCLGGVWIQHVVTGQHVSLEGVAVVDDAAIGIAIAGQSSGVTIRDCSIHGTSMATLPSLVGGTSAGSITIGDGLLWTDRSEVDVDGLEIGGSARVGFLIDGEVASSSRIAHVTLVDGDDAQGIVQQGCDLGTTLPTLGEGAPDLACRSDEPYPVP